MTKKLTRQAIFDMMATFTINQGSKCVNENGNCKYVSGGRGCALGGPLAALGLVSPRFDRSGVTANSLVDPQFGEDSKEPMMLPGIDLMMALSMLGVQEDDLRLIGHIQNAHDGAPRFGDGFIPEFKYGMRKIAKNYRLSKAVLS